VIYIAMSHASLSKAAFYSRRPAAERLFLSASFTLSGRHWILVKWCHLHKPLLPAAGEQKCAWAHLTARLCRLHTCTQWHLLLPAPQLCIGSEHKCYFMQPKVEGSVLVEYLKRHNMRHRC
jgi:hypothetical protein